MGIVFLNPYISSSAPFCKQVHKKIPVRIELAWNTQLTHIVSSPRIECRRISLKCPGYVRTSLVEKQIPEQAKDLGISEEDVIKKVMLKDTIDGEFTTVENVADVALFFASFDSNALTGQSLVVSHGWFMQ